MNRWCLYPARRGLARVRLLCFPHAGGAASVFYEWGALLPEWVELVAVQMPGRATRLSEAPLLSIAALAEGAWNGLAPLLDRPYALLGHSLGSLVAFEFARLAQSRQCAAPAVLMALGCPPPHLLGSARTYDLPTTKLIKEMQRLGAASSALLHSPQMLELVLPALRADLEAYETYQFTDAPALRCPIQAWAGVTDASLAPAALGDWAVHTTAAFSAVFFAGGHFFLEEDRAAVLASVQSALIAVLP